MNITQDILPILQSITPVAVAIYLLSNLKLVLNLQFSVKKWRSLFSTKKGKKKRAASKAPLAVKEFSLGYKEISIKVEIIP